MQTLKNSGAPPFKDCDMLKDYVFPISNLSDLLQQGLAVTSMGISAALDLIRLTASSSPDVAMELSAILAIDARHSEYLRQ